jgi:hypothetical protein
VILVELQLTQGAGVGRFNPDQVAAVLPDPETQVCSLVCLAGTDKVIAVVGRPRDVAFALCNGE